ncbi:MAG: hypothetical protein HY810_01365 [Candidatus Omnitrophica bacterium]|nr:hypothetical protein [Candidatus Omnitrophota bacterium]
MKKQKSIFNHKPEALIFSSFFLAALIGAILLRLPVSCAKIPLSGIDALFMSVSAVCVTGLSVADIGKDLTLFGQLVILVLIQLGGLGIMTFSLLFLIAIGKKMPLYSKLCVPDLSQDVSFRNIKYSVFLIFAMALLIESAGAVLLFFDFRNHYTFPFAVYSSIFHSVSAYCNAGFSLYPDNLIGFNNNPYVMSILMYLIVLGGLGFVVIHEVSRVVFNKMRNDKKSRINLHSKIALTGSAGFVIMGAVIIWLLEKQGIMRDMPLSHQIFNSFFLSVTSRTAGFNTLEMSRLTNPTLFLLLSFMFIGGCPGSTAGGIKYILFFPS